MPLIRLAFFIISFSNWKAFLISVIWAHSLWKASLSLVIVMLSVSNSSFILFMCTSFHKSFSIESFLASASICPSALSFSRVRWKHPAVSGNRIFSYLMLWNGCKDWLCITLIISDCRWSYSLPSSVIFLNRRKSFSSRGQTVCYKSYKEDI